jgi:hypothetical protein
METMIAQRRFVLVYQAGIANVFEVASFNLSDYGRDARRIMQNDFGSCINFARGLVEAGHLVGTASCNKAGDITEARWSFGLEDCPLPRFREKAREVWSPSMARDECLSFT